MMVLDYTRWQGLHEVAKHWYTKFVPELMEVAEKHSASDAPAKRKGAESLESEIATLLVRPEHAWFQVTSQRARWGRGARLRRSSDNATTSGPLTQTRE